MSGLSLEVMKCTEIQLAKSNFELKFYAWGQFNFYAEVYIKGQGQPIII